MARASTDGAAAEGLEHPQQDQLPRAVGQRAGQAAEQVQGDTGQQHRAPAETVGQGAVEQHADAEADQEAADARCTWASLAPRSAAIAGRLGRYMSIDSGPNATSADNSSNRRRSPLPS